METWIEKAFKAGSEVGSAIGDLAREGKLHVDEINQVSFHGGAHPTGDGQVVPTIHVHFDTDQDRALAIWDQIVRLCPYAKAEGITIAIQLARA